MLDQTTCCFANKSYTFNIFDKSIKTFSNHLIFQTWNIGKNVPTPLSFIKGMLLEALDNNFYFPLINGTETIEPMVKINVIPV